MPAFIEPMAATLTNRAFDDPEWLFEVKWDGYRIEAVIRDGKTLAPFENVQIPAMGTRRAGTFFQNLAALWGKGMVRTTVMPWILWIPITFSKSES